MRSLVEYSSIVYSCASQNITKRLQVLQNQALRLFLHLNREHGNPNLHSICKIDKIKDRFDTLNFRYFTKAQLTENPMIDRQIEEFNYETK